LSFVKSPFQLVLLLRYKSQMTSSMNSSAANLNERTLSYLALILNTIESKDWKVRFKTLHPTANSILYDLI
jgi:hypothetical protein